jgi:outer membrane lipoprotein SlyB
MTTTSKTHASAARPLRASALLVAVLAASVLAGCATATRSGDLYSRHEALIEQTVRMGVVESVRDVKLDRRPTGVGKLAGAVIGSIAGSSIGQGRGADIGAVGGAVAGGVIGQSIEGSAAAVPALEITVRLADGTLIAIVQEAGSVRPRAGETVRLLSRGGTTRVVPA